MSLLDLQQKVVDELNTSTFSITGFTAEKRFVPEVELSELENIKLFVVPAEVVLGRRDRDTRENTVVVEIGILQRMYEGITEEDILNFVSEVADHFFEKDLTPYRADENNVEIEAVYDLDQLQQNNTMLSLVSLTYKEEV